MPDFSIEQRFDGPVCGIDEVGRGPLAGPVVAACVHIPRDLWSLPLWGQVNDSKKLSAKKREAIAAEIKACVPFGIGSARVDEIDTHNILNATFIAMRRAYGQMIGLSDDQNNNCTTCEGRGLALPTGSPPARGLHLSSDDLLIRSSDHLTALIDGNRSPKNFPTPTLTVIKGDALSVSIAAASIVAKVARDAVMAELAREYPEYGWDGNAGYGTAAHLRALAEHGPCPHHRSSFAPIKAYKS